ncbi:hypothetical protein E0I56_005670 [Escherichia coli]|nr:hypothetical protein [Escherichia coli]
MVKLVNRVGCSNTSMPGDSFEIARLFSLHRYYQHAQNGRTVQEPVFGERAPEAATSAILFNIAECE